MSVLRFTFVQACKVKTVSDLIDKSVTSLKKMSATSKPKELEECAKYLDALKKLLIGNGSAESVVTTLTGEIAKKAESTDFFLLLVERLEHLDFEAKKDGVQIFTKLVRREVGQEPMARHPTVEYICKEPKILETLVKGYEDKHSQVDALNSGLMLRECVKMEPLVRVLAWHIMAFLHTNHRFHSIQSFLCFSLRCMSLHLLPCDVFISRYRAENCTLIYSKMSLAPSPSPPPQKKRLK